MAGFMDLLGNLFGGWAKQEEGWRYSMPPLSPEQKQLYDWGYGRMTGGFPEYDEAFNTQWNDYRRQLAEEYQARRGFQPLGTPEVAQMSQARALGQANLAGQKVLSQQQLYNMLRGLIWQPGTEYTQPQPSGGQNFMSFFQPILSSFLDGKGGGMQDWQKWLKMLGGGQNKTQDISNYQNPYQYDYNVDYETNPYGENYSDLYSNLRS